MSFLKELKEQKDKLKGTVTIVTKADGHRFIEKGGEFKVLDQNSFGFVVDTKPDDIPVMILEHLYLGSQDCAVDSVLNKYDIVNVLSLGIDVKSNANKMFVDFLDLPETDIKPLLRIALPFIQSSLINGENILVHCNAGVSRASTVVIAYLMHYEDMKFEDAYGIVKEKRPAIQPNDGFRRQLKSLQQTKQVM